MRLPILTHPLRQLCPHSDRTMNMIFHNQKGQALVELALGLMLLSLLVFGVFEFGRVMYVKNTLNLAAREGVRRASVSDPLIVDTIQNQVRASLPGPLQSGLVVSVTPASPQHGIDTVTVNVQLPFTTVVPLLITQLDNITVSAEASMRYE